MKIKKRSSIPELKTLIPMTEIKIPHSMEVKTVTRHYTESKVFDAEINELLADGWRIEDYGITNNESLIILYAFLVKTNYKTISEEKE